MHALVLIHQGSFFVPLGLTSYSKFISSVKSFSRILFCFFPGETYKRKIGGINYSSCSRDDLDNPTDSHHSTLVILISRNSSPLISTSFGQDGLLKGEITKSY